MAEKTKGTLVSWRPDIKVLDCTLRDGGLVNNFRFTDEFVKALYQANVQAGVDYMEFGYKASKDIFKVEDFGKWKFCDEEAIREIVGNNETDLKIAVMTDVGRTDYKKDIIKNNATGEITKTGLPNSNVLYYGLENDAWCCVRPSGTEPKIKFYMGVKGKTEEEAEQELKELTKIMEEQAKM